MNIDNVMLNAVFLVVIFILLIIIVIQAKEIKRQKCSISCEKYKKENETGLFIQLENLVWWFKRNWSLFVIYTASSSLILLFLLTLIYPQKDTLITMNNWVSLILGFTALFMSIASMVLSFYNVEQSHNNEVRTAEMNERINQKLSNLDSLSNQITLATMEIQEARKDIRLGNENIQKKLESMCNETRDYETEPDDSWAEF